MTRANKAKKQGIAASRRTHSFISVLSPPALIVNNFPDKEQCPHISVRNPVEILSKKFTSIHIPKEAVRKAAENARILETRVKTGNLGKTDRPNTRAAVLLELAYRQETKSHLPWKMLAAAVNVKVLQLEQLQQSLNNYLQDPKSQTLLNPTDLPQKPPAAKHTEYKLSTQVQAIRKQITGQKRPLHLGEFSPSIEDDARRRSSRAKTAEADMRRIEDLAIRLQILDPSKACRLTKQFFDEMTNWVTRDPLLSESDRRGQLYDFVRYGPAYEAAALYCVAEGDFQLEDLEKASTEFTRLELKQVLPFVKETFQHLKRNPILSKVSSNTKAKYVPSGAIKMEQFIEKDQDIEEQEKAREMEEDAQFQTWRQLQLEYAMQQARIQMKDDPEVAHTDSKVLAFAADAVLRKYSVLQDQDVEMKT